MHNAEAAIEPAFYDHQDDSVQQDRVAADWGADEVFASVPRRRIRGDQHGAAAARRTAVAPRRVSGPVADADGEAAERAAWLAEVEAELLAAEAPAVAVSSPAEVPQPEELTEGVAFEAPAAWAEPSEPAGRRTVTITGNPGAVATTRPLVTDRRRPPRSVDERIGGRPDRIAGWSFGMGLLLIVVAAFS